MFATVTTIALDLNLMINGPETVTGRKLSNEAFQVCLVYRYYFMAAQAC